MRTNRSLTRLVAGAVVTTVTAGSALLVNGVAGATPSPGTSGTDTILPATGTDSTPMSVTTSGPCPSQSSGADAQITGPVGAADPTKETFPPGNPFPIVTNNSVQFSTTSAFTQQFKLLLKDAATQRHRHTTRRVRPDDAMHRSIRKHGVRHLHGRNYVRFHRNELHRDS